jgi:hypothetical protein
MNEENRHQDFIRVRSQLEGSLNGKFREATWRKILAGGYVQDYLAGNETWNWESLRGLAQDELNYVRELEREASGPPGKSGEVSYEGAGDVAKPQPFEPVFAIRLPEREKRRADVLLEIEMRQAAERPDVKRFRDERLEGQWLLFDEAEAFISPGPSEEITDRELADLARRLERDYGWHRNDAAWFVLNGAAPRLRPLTTRVSTHWGADGPSRCEITLQVAPWIPSEVVEKAFVQMRDGVRRGSGPGTVGERRLEVLRFVEMNSERRGRGRRPGFAELLLMWNQEYPHWYYDKYRALAKAYREAYQEVFRPRYQMPNAESPGPDAGAS